MSNKNEQGGPSKTIISIYSLVPALGIRYGGMHNFIICKSSITNEPILVGDGYYDTKSKLSVFILLTMCLHPHVVGMLPHTPKERRFCM